MVYDIKGTQKLYLWSLLGNGGEGFMREQAFELKAPERNALIKQGLIESDKRKRPSGHAAMYHTLTDKGWDWAANTMQEPIDSKSTKGGVVLSQLLKRLDAFLKLKGFGLAELLVPVSPESLTDTGTKEREIATRLRESLLRLSGGKRGQRIRLAQLRAQLPDVPAERINRVLAAMQGKGELVLYPMDDPQERTAEDEAAAIDIAGVGKRHLVFLEE